MNNLPPQWQQLLAGGLWIRTHSNKSYSARHLYTLAWLSNHYWSWTGMTKTFAVGFCYCHVTRFW